jgi:hypothetical protein
VHLVHELIDCLRLVLPDGALSDPATYAANNMIGIANAVLVELGHPRQEAP